MSVESGDDKRTTKQLLTQWRKLEEIRRSLVRNGLVNGDASPADIVNALRKAIPPGTFDDDDKHE